MTLEQLYRQLKELMHQGYGSLEVRAAEMNPNGWPDDNFKIINLCVHPGRSGESSYVCFEYDPTTSPTDEDLNSAYLAISNHSHPEPE
jgi:hypothetical protein